MALSTSSGTRGNTPPYVSYPTFKTLMQELREHTVPSRIDRSVLKRFSGITGTQLLTTLRFLRLIDDKDHPTPRLHEIVAAFGTEQWREQLGSMLREHYEPLFSLDLGNATRSHFDETFRKAFPGADSVIQKTTNFFLGAAKDAGIVISDRVLDGRKPRAGTNGSTPRPRRSAAEKPPKLKTRTGAATEDGTDETTSDTWEDRLLAKFPELNPEWPPEVQAKWFESFEKLMALRK